MNTRLALLLLMGGLAFPKIASSQTDQGEQIPLAINVAYADGVVTMRIKNNSSKPVYLKQLDGRLVAIRLEVWALGRGVELYSAHDARWRRASAFVGMKPYELRAGVEVIHKIQLSEALPESDGNDDLAKDIKESVAIIKTGRIAALVYHTIDPNSPSGHEARGEIEIAKPPMPVKPPLGKKSSQPKDSGDKDSSPLKAR
jgi:hypothetical protein